MSDRIVILASIALIATPLRCTGDTLSPFSEFQGLSPAELNTVQCKVTDVGDHVGGHALPTLAFSVTGHQIDLSVFLPFHRAGFENSYGADQSSALTFAVGPAEMSSFIDGLATLPAVTDGGVDGYQSLSLSVVKSGSTKVFESIVDATSGKAVFQKMLDAFSANTPATNQVTAHACMYGLLPGTPMADVTSAVSLSLRGFRKDRVTGQYVGTVRVTNTSGQQIVGPIIFVCRPPENMSLASSNGVTCVLFPRGAPFQMVSSGSLSAGQHVDLIVRVDNPDADNIAFASERVYSGAGNK